MVSHRRLLWLLAMLAGLAAAMLYLSGTASAKPGSTASGGTGNDTRNSATTNASSGSDAGESAQESSDTTTADVQAKSGSRRSSLASAINQAKDALSSAVQRQSSRQTPDTTTPKPITRSPSVRTFQINAAAAPVAKTNSADAESADESVTVAPPAKPRRQPLAAVIDVLSNLGAAMRPDPPAVLPRVTPLVAKAQRAALTLVQKPPVGTEAVASAPTEAANPLAASIPSVTGQTAVDGVVVGQSTLAIPCGPACEVPADWYFPTGPDPPSGMIYLQHGFLARGPWYSTTAAILAKQTNSIVVAPTISSNFLRRDGLWLNGEPMEQAVASMFDDRTELTASASQAAGHPVTLPDKFVLVGHSAGGGFAVAVAGDLAGTSAYDNLAGVVMFDGVALNDTMTTSLREILDLPVYQIAAPSYIWNNFGSGTAQLVQARPGQFTGFQLAGGSHVDAMRGKPLFDFAAQLVAGFSRPANVEAVRTLAVSWINHMYDDSRDWIHADPGQTIHVGDATATSLPAPEPPGTTQIRNILLVIERFLFGSSNSHAAPTTTARIAA